MRPRERLSRKALDLEQRVRDWWRRRRNLPHRCETCRYYCGGRYPWDEEGDCLRYPRVPFVTETSKGLRTECEYPRTHPQGWCGEWKREGRWNG